VGFSLGLSFYKKKAPFGAIILALKARIIAYTSRGTKRKNLGRKKGKDPDEGGGRAARLKGGRSSTEGRENEQ